MAQAQIFEKVQYAPQASAYATEGTPYTELSRVQGITIIPINNNKYGRGLGEGVNAVSTYYGQFDVDGNVNYDVVEFDFLKHWVGPKTGSGTAGSHYVLTESDAIALNNTSLQPFSIEYLNDSEGTDSVTAVIGCVGESFSLSSAIQEKLHCSADFKARSTLYRVTHTAYTAITDPAFIMINGTWSWGASPSTVSGVRSFSINWGNNLIWDTYSIESRFRLIPVFGERVITGIVGIMMTSALAATIINDFYGKEAGGVYTPADGSVSVSPTASLEFKIELVNGTEYATIQLDEVAIDRISLPAVLGGGLKILTFEWTARKGLGNVPIEWWTVP